MLKQIPNFLSSLRILGAVGLLFFSPSSSAFWAIYILCGISDMLDGFLARRLHAESEIGAKLDSISDLIFVLVCIYKLIPIVDVPSWIWIWVGFVAFTKVTNIISSLVVYKKILFPHTIANKVTGFLLFVLIPVLILTGSLIPTVVLCAVATFAAAQEGHLIRTKSLDENAD